MSCSAKTCPVCGRTFTHYASVCSTCRGHAKAQAQRQAGETCHACGKAPNLVPLIGYKRYGRGYCEPCYKQRPATGETWHKPEPDIPEHITQTNRRALAYWLARNYRTRERQAA